MGRCTGLRFFLKEEKQMQTKHVLIIAAAVVLGLSALTIGQPSSVTMEGLLPGISTELGGTYAINIATTASTVGLDVSEETALTNTVNGTIKSTHTTSGTPANSIGNGYWVYQETSAANTEKIMEINGVVSDSTLGSEDASFSIELMAGGAASSEVFSIGSTGIVSLDGGATLDNTTAATELAIAETNIQLSGIIDLEGGNVTVNDDSGDYDFIVESDGDAAAFKVDAGLDTAIFGAWEAGTIATDVTTSYSISSASKARYHIQTAGAAATAHLMTDLLTSPGPGGLITLKTGDASDIVVDTQGAETIDGAATYTIDGTLEAVTFLTDGTNWYIVGSYLE
jgi:hypothetical protein